jgi:hypothetical protein
MRMRTSPSLLLFMASSVAALMPAGCDGDSSWREPITGIPFITLAPDPGFPGTPGSPDAHADLFTFDPLTGCAVSNPTNLGTRTPLRIFRGPGVSRDDLRDFLGGLQRYYAQYGVTFSSAYDVIDVPFGQAMILDLETLGRRVKAQTGVDINASSPSSLPFEKMEEVERAVGIAIMHNIREILRVYAMPRRAEINVVILGDMVTDNLPKDLESFKGILGLGLSPELLVQISNGDPAYQLYDWLGLGEEFTPTTFLGVGPVAKYLAQPDIAIAHEIGHAYGLAHVTQTGNLLHQGEVTCTLSLDVTQLERVRQATSAFGHEAGGIESYSLTSRAGEFVLAIESLLGRR